jgi:hypothetical protein
VSALRTLAAGVPTLHTTNSSWDHFYALPSIIYIVYTSRCRILPSCCYSPSLALPPTACSISPACTLDIYKYMTLRAELPRYVYCLPVLSFKVKQLETRGTCPLARHRARKIPLRLTRPLYALCGVRHAPSCVMHKPTLSPHSLVRQGPTLRVRGKRPARPVPGGAAKAARFIVVLQI